MKDGGSAFPGIAGVEVIATVNKYGVQEAEIEKPIYSIGMTLRDYFAGQALAGFFAFGRKDYGYETMAEVAYECADAMITAREEDA